MAFQKVGRCVVLVHSTSSPIDSEWNPYIDFLVEQKIDRLLVYSWNGAPTPTQRQYMKTKLTQANLTVITSVVTKSGFARGVVTAISWFSDNIRAYAPTDLPAALDFIHVPQSYAVEIRAVIAKLNTQVGAPKS